MSADFWPSYVSGPVSIAIGNRLDIIKTGLQAGNRAFGPASALDYVGASKVNKLTNYLRGSAAPILGYGALNSILFVTYNRILATLDPSIFDYKKLAGVDLSKIWTAGAVGGFATWVISTPTELIKCRTQLVVDGQRSSYSAVLDIIRRSGFRGFYLGGTATAVRNSVGYGCCFWTYELSKRLLLSRQPDPFIEPEVTDILLAGGIAGVASWTSIYPLDVIKTIIQTKNAHHPQHMTIPMADEFLQPKSSWAITKDIMRVDGVRRFYQGLGVCSVRAFIVNAIQFYVYERMMKFPVEPTSQRD